MKISASNLHKIINDYLVQVIIPKLPNNISRFSLAFMSNYISENFISSYLNGYYPILKALKVIDENNLIDIDVCKINAIKALNTCNGTINFMNYNFDSNDIDEIYRIAQNYQY